MSTCLSGVCPDCCVVSVLAPLYSHGLRWRRLSMYVSLFTAVIPVHPTSELFYTWHQRFPAIFLKLCMLVFLLFIFLYRVRPCDGPIPHIRNHTTCSHYTVGGSRTSVVKTDFSHKCIAKISGVFQVSCSDQEERHGYICEIQKKYKIYQKLQFKGGEQFLLNCSCIIWSSPLTFTNTGGDAWSFWRWPQQIKHWILTRKGLLL
jgi:hypothetical protein